MDATAGNSDGFLKALADVIVEAGEFLNGRKVEPQVAERQAWAWRKHLRGIPETKLQSCLEVWQSNGPRQTLRAMDIREAWFQVQRAEPVQQARTVYHGGQALYTCPICQDVGYCYVWQWRRVVEFQDGGAVKQGGHTAGWSRAVRPCGCGAAPMVQRMPKLSRMEYTRLAILNEYARTVELIEHGAPSPQWQQTANSYKQQVENAEAA